MGKLQDIFLSLEEWGQKIRCLLFSSTLLKRNLVDSYLCWWISNLKTILVGKETIIVDTYLNMSLWFYSTQENAQLINHLLQEYCQNYAHTLVKLNVGFMVELVLDLSWGILYIFLDSLKYIHHLSIFISYIQMKS